MFTAVIIKYKQRNAYSQAIFVRKKLEQEPKPKEIKQSIASVALCIDLRVICVMQIMLVIQPAPFSKALSDKIIRLSVNKFENCTVTKILMGTNFMFTRPATENLTASFTKCHSSKK